MTRRHQSRHPLSKLPGRLAITYDLACNIPHTRWIFGDIVSKNLRGFGHEALPLGHCGLQTIPEKGADLCSDSGEFELSRNSVWRLYTL
ncbi:unnamed protein product [Larinioides sclopetarius]|uniref:Uncharacterized protein n=1 Tax=Larinioides sclopetarius TaxID=280406 RepID=A0AAV2AQ33_9ARAC